ncbi:hypothetical protein LPJ73_005982 [Coemansia sp. RSA 2703]|nr:hypothetical protein LPJ73_005982 [Coemansia sp. RSA 2703]KAJ2386040.1 hypothetical protein GGI05_004508 [Coemansia sp. RSA 2603]
MRLLSASALLLLAGSAFAIPQVVVNGFAFDPFTGSGSFLGAAGSVDAAGNSFLRVDQDTRVHGQNIANLNENSVTGQQGGPAVEANGAVVVVAN